MQTTEKPKDLITIASWKMPRLLSVGYPLAALATVAAVIIAAPAAPLVLLGVATAGLAVSLTTLFAGLNLWQKQKAAPAQPVQNNQIPQPTQNKEPKMTVQSPAATVENTLTAQEEKSYAAARGFVIAVGAFLIAAFGFSSDAKASEKSDEQKQKTAYVVSPAILNNEEKRRQPSNPKKSGQKKALRALFNNIVPRSIGKVVNKPQGRPYPQTHIKRGACNNLRQS